MTTRKKPGSHPEEIVLLYRLGPDTDKGALACSVLQKLGMISRQIGSADLQQTIALLIDSVPTAVPRLADAVPTVVPQQADFEPMTGSSTMQPPIDDDIMQPELMDEMIIMSGLTDDRLQTLLQTLREAGAAPIRLKAVVTEHNRDWRLIDLIHELHRERRFMAAYTALQQKIQMGQTIFDAADPATSPESLQALAEAEQLLEGSEPPSITDMDQAAAKLQACFSPDQDQPGVRKPADRTATIVRSAGQLIRSGCSFSLPAKPTFSGKPARHLRISRIQIRQIQHNRSRGSP